jgi:hypothetical protein
MVEMRNAYEILVGKSAMETATGSWEHSNEPSGSMKCGKCLENLRNCQLVKKHCPPCFFKFIYFFILG